MTAKDIAISDIKKDEEMCPCLLGREEDIIQLLDFLLGIDETEENNYTLDLLSCF